MKFCVLFLKVPFQSLSDTEVGPDKLNLNLQTLYFNVHFVRFSRNFLHSIEVNFPFMSFMRIHQLTCWRYEPRIWLLQSTISCWWHLDTIVVSPILFIHRSFGRWTKIGILWKKSFYFLSPWERINVSCSPILYSDLSCVFLWLLKVRMWSLWWEGSYSSQELAVILVSYSSQELAVILVSFGWLFNRKK